MPIAETSNKTAVRRKIDGFFMIHDSRTRMFSKMHACSKSAIMQNARLEAAKHLLLRTRN